MGNESTNLVGTEVLIFKDNLTIIIKCDKAKMARSIHEYLKGTKWEYVEIIIKAE